MQTQDKAHLPGPLLPSLAKGSERERKMGIQTHRHFRLSLITPRGAKMLLSLGYFQLDRVLLRDPLRKRISYNKKAFPEMITHHQTAPDP